MPLGKRGHHSVGVCKDRFMGCFFVRHWGPPGKKWSNHCQNSNLWNSTCKRKTGVVKQQDGTQYVSIQAIPMHTHSHRLIHKTAMAQNLTLTASKKGGKKQTKKKKPLFTIISVQCLQNTLERWFWETKAHTIRKLTSTLQRYSPRKKVTIYKCKHTKQMWTLTQTNDQTVHLVVRGFELCACITDLLLKPGKWSSSSHL